MRFRSSLVLVALVLIGAAIATSSIYTRKSAEREFSKQVSEASINIPQNPISREKKSDLVVSSGTSFSELLQEADLDPAEIARAIDAARPVFNFRRLREGNHVTVNRSADGHLESICYAVDADHELWITRSGDDYIGEVRDVPSTVKVEAVAAELHGSLFETIMEMGERPELAIRLAEIFAYDLDFYTDPQPGDTFRMVLERREYQNGQPSSYGRILSAEYVNAGHAYTAVLFGDPSGQAGYYTAEGKSLQKAFLRSPLKFAARISSHYSRNRFHPVLKIYRPHLGTDYAAPTGTPVQSIATGKVIFSGRNGGGGNVVEVRHSNGYVSYYMHLSRRSVNVGQKVQQGQRIGLVGMTGLATGPHLDFRLRRNGQFVNFERMHLPPAHPVARKDWDAFVATRDKWIPMMSAAAISNRNAPLAAEVSPGNR